MTDVIAGIVNGKVVYFNKVRYTRADTHLTEGTFFLLDNSQASLDEYEKTRELMLNEKEKDMNEGRSWYGGGYGGTTWSRDWLVPC